MSAHMKARLTSAKAEFSAVSNAPGKKPIELELPESLSKELEKWLAKEGKLEGSLLIKIHFDSKAKKSAWEECTPWEEVAASRIAKYTKAGIALRGARYRENLSQKQLAELCGISQDNLSKMECGKRPIGPHLAERLGKALHIASKLLLNPKTEIGL